MTNSNGTVESRWKLLMSELDSRFQIDKFKSNITPEEQFLGKIDDQQNKIDALTIALNAAIIALDDWTCTIAPTFCNDQRVAEANTRVHEHGTLWYIATVLEQCNKAKE